MKGFTLIELMLVTALVGIFLALGLPSLRTLKANMITVAEEQRLLALLRLARASATYGHGNALLCPLDARSAPACGSSAGEGWLLFQDRNADRVYNDHTDQLLRLERLSSTRELRVLRANATPFSGAVTYRPDGSVAQPVTLRLCAPGSTRVQRVVINLSGRIRRAREAMLCPA